MIKMSVKLRNGDFQETASQHEGSFVAYGWIFLLQISNEDWMRLQFSFRMRQISAILTELTMSSF